MANLQRILGSLMGSGFGGRSGRGSGLVNSLAAGGLGGLAGGGLTGGLAGGLASGMMGGRGGGGLMRNAGLAALGYLAYRAYSERQSGQQRPGQESQAAAGRGEPSLGERISGLFSSLTGTGADTGTAPRGGSSAEAEVESNLDDPKAELLIQAMIAAANADGQIDADERRRILGRLEEANASADDKAWLDRQLDHPAPIESLLRRVDSPETAEQFYVASEFAITSDSQTERSYLRYLADRLGIEPQRAEELNRIGQ